MPYQHVVFMQGEEAGEAFKMLNSSGEEAVIDYLAQWDYGEGEIAGMTGAGRNDDTYRSGKYLLSWNENFDYIGLEKVLSEKERQIINKELRSK